MGYLYLMILVAVGADASACCAGRNACSNGGLQCDLLSQCCGSTCCAAGSICTDGACVLGMNPIAAALAFVYPSVCRDGQSVVRSLYGYDFPCSKRSQAALVCPQGTHCEEVGAAENYVCCRNPASIGTNVACGLRPFTFVECELNLNGSASGCRLDRDYGCVERTANLASSQEAPVLSGTCFLRCGAPGWISDAGQSVWTGYGVGNPATQCACTQRCRISNTCCGDYGRQCGYLPGYNVMPS